MFPVLTLEGCQSTRYVVGQGTWGDRPLSPQPPSPPPRWDEQAQGATQGAGGHPGTDPSDEPRVFSHFWGGIRPFCPAGKGRGQCCHLLSPGMLRPG